MIGSVTATITAENTFTDWKEIHDHYNYSVSGINGDTVTLQRTFDGGATTKDVASIAADVEVASGYETERGVKYRIGVKTGGYSAGTILVRISF